MKLIDMLVEDGLNGWQWPNGVKCITQDYGSGPVYRGVVFGYREEPYLKKNIWLANSSNGHADVTIKRYDTVADDWATAIITREQYESALAEKEHPLPWDKKNKPCPTLGAECRGCPDCGRRVSCTSDDITDDAVRAEMGMNIRSMDAALAAKNEGWIEWGGGERPPVSTNTAVDVKFKNGNVQSGYLAGEYSWVHAWQDSNIIAYRLHKPTKSEQVRADAWNAYASITKADDESDLNECIGQDAAQVWGGEGKPAIGEKCEHHSGGQWEAVTIAGIYENLVTGFTDYWMVKEDGSSYTVGNPYRFRPIRSEADRRRDEAAQALCNAGGGNGKVDEKSGYGSCWFGIYDAIAAGKIPGVKLED